MNTSISREWISSKTRLFLSVLTAAVFSTLFLVGCGNDNNPSGSGGGVSYDQRLILDDGWAWVGSYWGSTYAFMPKANGALEYYSQMGSSWELESEDGDNWYTKGGKVYIIDNYGGYSGEFTVSANGNTVTFVEDEYGESITFTKTQINLSGVSGGAGGDVILPDGQAWTNYQDYPNGGSRGYIFRNDGTFLDINNNSGSWEVYRIGIYTIDGGKITMDGYISGDLELPYSVLGNTLIINGWHIYVTDVGTPAFPM